MVRSLICFFLSYFFYIERKWLLMRSLSTVLPLKWKLSQKFQRFNTLDRFSIKMKNCKTLYEVQTASRLKEIFQPPLTHPSPDKILLRLWNKNFITEIYRNIQTFTFKVLQGCGSWASRNDAVQMLLLTSNRNMLAGKFVKSERVLAVLRVQFVVNVKLVEIRKMGEVFWAKLYCKMSDFFRYFLLALRLSARKSDIKNNSDNVHWNVWANIKNLYAWNNVFKKRIPNVRFWIIFILIQISLFSGLL